LGYGAVLEDFRSDAVTGTICIWLGVVQLLESRDL
jgi:hypothetical protein